MSDKTRMRDEQLLTVAEVAKFLRCNEKYVYKLIKAGILPAIELGRLKVLRSDLFEMLDKYKGCDLSDPENVVCKFDN